MIDTQPIWGTNGKVPLVSVVIATYRRATLVPKAIRSALAQTIANLEVIVVDDASPDDTERVVSAIDDARIRYTRHKLNRGLPASRNTGMRLARGEFIAFLDDDDEWFPTKLEKQVALCIDRGFHAALSASFINDGEIRRFDRPEILSSDLRKGNEFAPGSGLLAEARVLRELWFDESIGQGEDWDMLIRIVQRKWRIGYVDEPLYRVNDGGHTRMTNAARNLSMEDLEKRMRIIYKHKQFFGRYWFRRHVAGMLLSYFWYREQKLTQVRYAIRRCGIAPVLAVFADKVMGRARRRLAGRILREV